MDKFKIETLLNGANTKTCIVCGEQNPHNDRFVCYQHRDHNVRSYSYKPEPKFSSKNKGFKGSKFFGVEIEVIPHKSFFMQLGRIWAKERGITIDHLIEDYAADMYYSSYAKSIAAWLTTKALGEEFVYLKDDGSIPSNGFEIVTHPFSMNYMKKYNMFDKFHELPLSSWHSSQCGTHVHVSRQGMSTLAQCKLLYFFAENDNLHFINKVAQRRPNQYCARANKNNMKDQVTYGGSRYTMVNFTNRNTIEFRMFKGNTKPDAIYRAVEFCDAITDFVKTQPATKLNFKYFIEYVNNEKSSKWITLRTWLLDWEHEAVL